MILCHGVLYKIQIIQLVNTCVQIVFYYTVVWKCRYEFNWNGYEDGLICCNMLP